MSEEDKTKLQQEIDNLKSVASPMVAETMSETDTSTLKTAVEAFTAYINEFSTKLYQQAGGNPNMDMGDANGANATNTDDIIDG